MLEMVFLFVLKQTVKRKHRPPNSVQDRLLGKTSAAAN
jgi:hypothetical protein